MSSIARGALPVALAVLLSCGGGRKPPEASDAGGGPPTSACLDNDGDGFSGTGDCSAVDPVDCNDSDPNARPGGTETCNGRDDDCDGQSDEGLEVRPYFTDRDGDGFGSEKVSEGCAPPLEGGTVVDKGGDCDDEDAAINPGAAESCNGKDDDCDGPVDDGLTFKDFYPDGDGDGFGDASGTSIKSCQASVMGRAPNSSDCNDQNPTIKPTAQELCNKIDDNCDGQADNDIVYQSYYPDLDGDGFGQKGGAAESSCSVVPGKVTNDQDCNDMDATVKPGAPESCNGSDDDCDGAVDDGLAFSSWWPDADGDGYGAANGTPVSACKPVTGRANNNLDCSDSNPSVKPGAPEVCNGSDDDCDGTVDDGLTFTNYYADADGDGYGAGTPINACQPIAGRVTNNLDCNDANAAVKPGAPESCNGSDDDCDGTADDGLAFASYWPDADGDGYGSKSASPQSACAPVSGKVTNNGDCDDTRSSVNPAATEVCNGLDDECDGQVDDGLTFANYWPDADGDGYGSKNASPQSACAPVSGKVTNNGDCDDGDVDAHPGAAERCNQKDDNCDGQVDNGTVMQSYYPDLDSDGYGAAGSTAQVSCAPVAGKVTNDRDCNDNNANVKPGAAELCNGIDDDCDNTPDDGLTFLGYYPDLDSDGYGAAGSTAQMSCAPVSGKVTNNQDCNDGNASIKPGQAELCDGVDQDCDGQIDEGLPTQSYYTDADGDGYGASGATPQASCRAVAGKAPNNQDCNDANASIRPGAAESCNNVDDDCDAQVDENNPGGGAACDTGQAGVCAAGTVTCQSGALTCLRNQGPSAEKCNGSDDDCDNQVDEDFPNKGQSCTSGLGVCARTGTYVCKADGSGTQCSATPGSSNAAACDGQDNDCDGVVDEPYLSSTNDVSTVPFTDIEVVPYYHSATGCAGGVNGTGTDALAGGAMVMAGGTAGLLFQKLDANGAPTGSAVNVAGLTYADVAIAQAGDGFVIAGLWSGGSANATEVDLYFVDANGTERARKWTAYKTTANAYDSLRVTRGNGRRVTVIWRESGVGLHLGRIEPVFNSTTSTWSITHPATPVALVANASMPRGVGADSTHWDWDASQTCASASSLRINRVAYLASSQQIRFFDVAEDGTSRSADTILENTTGTVTFDEPEVAFFRSANADQWMIAYTTANSGASPPNEDLNFWLSTNPSLIDYAYLGLATENGVDSIRRPRITVTPTRLWLTALRYVNDSSGFKRQMMSRKLTFSGGKDPASTTVELSATSGACSGAPPCRPGDKDGLATWAAKERIYYAGSGASPAGSYSSVLVCN